MNENVSDTMAEIQCKCSRCGDLNVVRVPLVKYHAWRAGEKIQQAFPDLSADERELLISGTCNPCWEIWFGTEE